MDRKYGLGAVMFLSAWLLVACAPSQDPCENLGPKFYCAGVLYDSGRQPQNLEDARDIVMEYVVQELEMSAEVLSQAQSPGSPPWFQVTCRLSDGTESGFDVGPDGKIYTIKYRN